MNEQSEQQSIEQRQLTTSWEDYSRDTSADIDRRHLAAAWNAPAWRKLWMAAEMSQATRELTLAGLRRRHPNADEHELRFRLASLLFDAKTAHRLCEQIPGKEKQNAT